MKLALALLLALSVTGCSEDEVTTTPTDAAVDYATPITERPDDGPDTNVVVDSATTEVATDSAAPDSRPGPDATPDTPAADAGMAPMLAVVQVGGIGGISFEPSAVTIKAGGKVRWVWNGAGHNVVSGSTCTADNKFCSPNDMSCATAPTSLVGTTYEHTFATAGSYPYFCKPHCTAGMIGSVTVVP